MSDQMTDAQWVAELVRRLATADADVQCATSNRGTIAIIGTFKVTDLRAALTASPPDDDPRNQFRSGTHRWRG